jgi:hypothetical protein
MCRSTGSRPEASFVEEKLLGVREVTVGVDQVVHTVGRAELQDE